MDNLSFQKKNDLSIVLCGQAGQGIQTVEYLLTRIFKLAGYNVFATKEYMSRIRGGTNSTEIRVSSGSFCALNSPRTPAMMIDFLQNILLHSFRELPSLVSRIIPWIKGGHDAGRAASPSPLSARSFMFTQSIGRSCQRQNRVFVLIRVKIPRPYF